MTTERHTYYEEYWGAKMPVYEYTDPKEEYEGELLELLKEKAKEELWDEIPEEVELYVTELSSGEDVEFVFNPKEDLTEEQYKELEEFVLNLIEGEQNEK